MSAEKKIVALLHDIRDLMQVLILREHPEDLTPELSGLSERNSRSWSLLAHREPFHVDDDADSEAFGDRNH